MSLKKFLTPAITIAAVGSMLAAPATSFAQDGYWRGGYYQHRQAQKDQWKNIAIGSAAVGLLGLLTHNDTLSVLGIGGAAYSGIRYSQDSGGNRDWRNGNGQYYNNGYGNGYGYNNGYSNGYGYDNGYQNNGYKSRRRTTRNRG